MLMNIIPINTGYNSSVSLSFLLLQDGSDLTDAQAYQPSLKIAGYDSSVSISVLPQNTRSLFHQCNGVTL